MSDAARDPLPLLHNASAAQRKQMPITKGAIHYFPDALAAVAYVSHVGNQQHNPGQPLHWAQEKSNDHLDCIGRHLAQLGTLDTDGVPHSWKLAWRALANLQIELQKQGAPKPAGAIPPAVTAPVTNGGSHPTIERPFYVYDREAGDRGC